MTSTSTSATDETGGKGLKGGALGLVSSVVVGVASTAPAYSLAASLGFIVVGGTLAAGVKAPGIVLLAFIPMYLIAVAYQELNKAEPDCGTTFTWAARAFARCRTSNTRTGCWPRARAPACRRASVPSTACGRSAPPSAAPTTMHGS